MKINRIATGLGIILVAAISFVAFLPREPAISPIKGYVAAFPGDTLNLTLNFSNRTLIIPRKTARITEINLGSAASVVSFTVDKKLGSGSIQTLFHPSTSSGGSLSEIQLRISSTWFSQELGQIELDVHPPTDSANSLTTEIGAFLLHHTDEATSQISFSNALSDPISITTIAAPGLTCLTDCPVSIEPGGTAILEVLLDPEVDWIRPWVHYETPTGTHMIPGPSFYRLPR